MIQEEGHRGDRDQRCSCLLAQRDKDDGCYDVSSRREPLGFIARCGGKRPFLKAQFCSFFFLFENETMVFFLHSVYLSVGNLHVSTVHIVYYIYGSIALL